jgi:hypothetical protein
MNGLVVYLRANEHIAYLRRDAKRQQDAQVAKHESFVVRVMEQLWRERPDRPPARPSDAEPTPARALLRRLGFRGRASEGAEIELTLALPSSDQRGEAHDFPVADAVFDGEKA